MVEERPNILFVFTDQQRFDAIGALGSSLLKTPHLDEWVQSGVTFTRAYTPCPVCVPARCSLVTGRPAHETGVVDNASMPFSEQTFMARLSDAGYQTHGVGKMHFDPDYRSMWGFESRDISEEGKPDTDYMEFLRDAGYSHVDSPMGLRGEYYYIPQPSQLPQELHETHWVADRSIDFLNRRDRERPFFLWTSFIKPHPPFENPNPWYNLYRAREMEEPFIPENSHELTCLWNDIQNRYKYRDGDYDRQLMRTIRAAYFACISFVDYQIGRILETLGDDRDNTIIVFSSDHGELLGDYGCVGKRCMLDPAVRIPMIVVDPRKKESAGTLCDKPVSLLDVFPTFLKAAGLEDYRVHEDGDDLLDIADGIVPRSYTFSQFSDAAYGLYMVTDGEWKYIYSAPDEKEWLFSLNSEEREATNMADSDAAESVKERLRDALISRFQAVGYSTAVDGDKWRIYGKTVLADDPDYGLLQQDMPFLQNRIDELGPDYARNVTLSDEDSYRILCDHSNPQVPPMPVRSLDKIEQK
ncbi:sulfatase family protein [Rubellicoccus peritrichatus]|uniref:Sulfatase-like hydrolase/transferase n=1 Tax=Rubellicoccus peritrichatus TaxID=3080537 RepID=A0AAQ3QX72_9BACT|nr:sulfatase-like hydrolase/transferase [Puniceicoccus sp. CR14]WOO42722.1 sulfatase-like hydrolase/transferase [Puniceicoccus sp. CR14]